MRLYEGCVENREDPLKLGRCQVRIVGLHTHDKNILKTEDLPWAYPLQPVTSAGISGIGHAPVGPVEGSWVLITFRDDDEQQPVMLGTVGGIPQAQSIIFDRDEDVQVLKNEKTGDLETIPNSDDDVPVVVESAPTTVETIQNSVSCSHLQSIPTTPPPEIKGDRAKAETNIKLLLDECCKAGFTKEQTCSLLAIVGGECDFVAKNESAQYSNRDRMMEIFKSAFKGDTTLGDKYVNWVKDNKGPISEFFEFVYSYSNKKGKELGNTEPGDGGKYYGKGFIQITGKSNYAKYTKSSSYDLVSNPDILNNDMQVSAKVSILYFKDRISANTSAHPGYFLAAKDAINRFDNPEKKTRLYEYFYGIATPASETPEKNIETTAPTDAMISTMPSPTTEPILGFKDPNNKYPLQSFMHEQDTNRLARGISKGTIVPKKESTRAVNIPKALNKGTYSEPTPPFSAKYPFNHVFESESGHVQEFDDTPGFERIHLYHKKGTFTEIDANGTEVHHIVGDSYHIIDRNGCLYVRGECNITVDGDTNIFARSDANVEVAGDATMKVGGDFNLGVAEDINITAGKSLNIDVPNIIIQANELSETASSMNINSTIYNETVGISSYRWNGDRYMFTGANTYERHDSGIDYSCPADPSRSSDSLCAVVISSPLVDPGLTPPSLGSPLYASFAYLVAPDRADEELSLIETPEDWAASTPEQRQKMAEKYPPVPVTPIEDSTPTGGNNNTVPVDCQIIYATEQFTSDFRLSEHFTLGMLFDGGFNKKHKLVDQNGLTKQQIVCNLSQLAKNILEPYLSILPGGIDGYGTQWKITSGYRQGSAKSQHNKGQACDISLAKSTNERNQATYDLVKSMESLVPYDQIILEYRGTNENWIHTSYVETGRRKMAFTMLNDKTYGTGFVLL